MSPHRLIVLQVADNLLLSLNDIVLITGCCSSRFIGLYDFETLTLLYYIDLYKQDIKSVIFTIIMQNLACGGLSCQGRQR